MLEALYTVLLGYSDLIICDVFSYLQIPDVSCTLKNMPDPGSTSSHNYIT